MLPYFEHLEASFEHCGFWSRNDLDAGRGDLGVPGCKRIAGGSPRCVNPTSFRLHQTMKAGPSRSRPRQARREGVGYWCAAPETSTRRRQAGVSAAILAVIAAGLSLTTAS